MGATPPATRQPLGPRVLLASMSTALALALAWWVWTAYRRPPSLHPLSTCIEDPVVGLRPRPDFIARGEMGPLLGANVPVVRHHDKLGLVREGNLEFPLSGPRVLLLGDSHMMGIVSTADNAASRLETMLRGEPGLSGCLVLNGACDGYNLYQYVLRTRALADRLRPDLLLVVVYMGNDFLDLEDLGRPHLDDRCQERPADPRPPPETTTARLARVGLRESGVFGGLFWQEFNQAVYFYDRPERLAVVREKSRCALRLLRREAERHGAGLLVALLPPVGMVFPERIREHVGAVVRQIMDARLEHDLGEWFRAELDREGIDSVDLLPVFQKDGRLEIYANDMHLWVPGHRLLADVLRGPTAKLLR